ncbi:2-hydroxymuconic semialdehyde dehydrogenase [Phenylobacterium sp.]|uniref:2-hydroxymuconic semialdehyde dehydrogenase n=1 Tax=Phenylobacterium sp. TaxID=1871053 RepID=UPI000AEDF580|nr:2-hydroxymuconic semialdehyde dehydrogenase [Phenylobacterium sp.]
MTPERVLASYVGGNFVDTGRYFDDINPVDGSRVAKVAEADAALVDRAVSCAREALAGDWGRMPVAHRARLLHRIADGIEARFEEFVAAEIADTGKDERHARTVDIARGVANFRFFADLVVTAHDQSFQTPTPDGRDAVSYVVRKPLGVVAVIAPWNLPLLLLSWKVAPALACGNAVVAKPSEETPFTATLLAEVMHEVGVPAGVFNLVHGFGRGSAGEALTAHPGVDAVTFTGSSKTGSSIMRAVADTVKPISFELGGKNAALVFADCDFEAAVDGVARSTFSNCGQVCLCTERVYVERPIYERFVEALKGRAEAIVVGRPEDPTTTMGPMISRQHRTKVLSYFDLALREGATVVAGGQVPTFGDERDEGAFIAPTIWTGLSDDARCNREEIFGPVCHIAPFDTEDEAIRRANDSDYGLAASIWTTDLARAHRAAPQIEAGLVWVNTWFLRDLRTPFGGVKLSGIGREGGAHSLAFYSEASTICVKY